MGAPRRVRRTSEEIRSRLLDAARELFAERGYDATTVRDISTRSGVAQQQLFHNFGSKDGIFDAAFVTPLAELVNWYVAGFNNAPPGSGIDERVANLVYGLYDLARDNRATLLTIVSRRALSGDPDAGVSDLLDHIARTLREMEGVVEYPPGIDLPAAVVTAAGMVFGTVLLEDMLYPAGAPRLDRDRVTAEMITTLLHGSLHRER
jgi:AcrR family transcriptional regulator